MARSQVQSAEIETFICEFFFPQPLILTRTSFSWELTCDGLVLHLRDVKENSSYSSVGITIEIHGIAIPTRTKLRDILK